MVPPVFRKGILFSVANIPVLVPGPYCVEGVLLRVPRRHNTVMLPAEGSLVNYVSILRRRGRVCTQYSMTGSEVDHAMAPLYDTTGDAK